MVLDEKYDATFSAGGHINVRIGAHLADDAQLVEPVDQRLANRRPLAKQGQRLSILEPRCKYIHILGVILPDGYVMMGDFSEAVERSDGVLVIVENCDVHTHL